MQLVRFVSLGLFAGLFAAATGCGPSKSDDKGVVDDSQPPSIPTEDGKADGASKVVAVDVQSPHPYANNQNQAFTVSLASLPACAEEARLHFRVLRTEADFDFVTVEPPGAPAQSFDGNRDDTWTAWFPINGPSVTVRLETDFSITRHGFEIDKIEWAGIPAGCPIVQVPPCGADEVDTAAVPGTCDCPAIPLCGALSDVEVRLHTAIGFNNRQKRIVGNTAFETHPGPADGPVTTEWGTVDLGLVKALVRRAAEQGLLQGDGYDKLVPAGTRRDTFQIKAGAFDVTFVAGEGQHTAVVQSLITEFEMLFTCGGGGLTCGAGLECEQGGCIEAASCVCPAVFDPVCSNIGQTFSNACAAGCAQAVVAHDGECGIAGDPCGGLIGASCLDDHRCRYGESQFDPPLHIADAAGECVARDYCDAPSDCNHLAHPAVPGAWQCNQNTCAWKAGPAWQAVPNGGFETAHPYANSTSVWKELFLPAGAQAMRLATTSFQLETGYDFLEVWTWNGAAWVRVQRYTGTAGPSLATEFPGRYHYLRFVSDSSITRHGFRVDAEYR